MPSYIISHYSVSTRVSLMIMALFIKEYVSSATFHFWLSILIFRHFIQYYPVIFIHYYNKCIDIDIWLLFLANEPFMLKSFFYTGNTITKPSHRFQERSTAIMLTRSVLGTCHSNYSITVPSSNTSSSVQLLGSIIFLNIFGDISKSHTNFI